MLPKKKNHKPFSVHQAVFNVIRDRSFQRKKSQTFFSSPGCVQWSGIDPSLLQVEVLDSSGLVLPVSLWVKRLDNASNSSSPFGAHRRSDQQQKESRLLCVMEPVERTVGRVHFDGDVSVSMLLCVLSVGWEWQKGVVSSGLFRNC